MKDVLDSYDRVSLEFIGNSNSLHELGLNSKRIEEAASRTKFLDVDSNLLIRTARDIGIFFGD